MRASKETRRRARQSPRRSKSLGDLSSVRTWRRHNDDTPLAGRVGVRNIPAAAPSAASSDSSSEPKGSREGHSAVGLLQASGLVVLVCAGALAIFAGWGRTDLVQLAAIFAVVGIGLVVASLWRHSSTAEATPHVEKSSRPRTRLKGATAPPWAALDKRVQRLVSQLEEVLEK